MIEGEDWRDIAGFGNRYAVSNIGQVKNKRTGRLLTGFFDKDGYRRVGLCENGSRSHKRVHRLVCEAFHGPAEYGLEAAHLDGSRRNNSATNLAWVTHAENSRHKISHGTSGRGDLHPKAKLTREQVIEAWLSAKSARELGDRFGVSPSAIETVRRGRNWVSVTKELPPRTARRAETERLGSREPEQAQTQTGSSHD